MPKKMKIAAVLLAAGESKRLGFPKQSVLVDGQKLISRQAKLILASRIDKLFIVTGGYRQTCLDILRAIEEPWQEIYHHEYALGIGSSIKAAINQIIKHSINFDGVLLCNCDQIQLSTGHLNSMIELANSDWSQQTLTDRKIIASSYQGILGSPVLLPENSFAQILTIADHQGAKSLLQKQNCHQIPLTGGELDIDTPADLTALDRNLKPKA